MSGRKLRSMYAFCPFTYGVTDNARNSKILDLGYYVLNYRMDLVMGFSFLSPSDSCSLILAVLHLKNVIRIKEFFSFQTS